MFADAEIQSGLAGAWRLMTGRADGLKLLNLSADGFWDSFIAIVISLPALGVGWVGIADELGADEGAAERLWIVAKLAAVDIGSWVLPLVALALAAPRAGIGARFVPYVVASNWASAIICWMMVPPALLRLVLPGQTDLASLLSLALFLFSMVLTWRMTSTVMARGAVVGTAVFAGMFVVSLACLLGIQTLLGIPSPL